MKGVLSVYSHSENAIAVAEGGSFLWNEPVGKVGSGHGDSETAVSLAGGCCNGPKEQGVLAPAHTERQGTPLKRSRHSRTYFGEEP